MGNLPVFCYFIFAYIKGKYIKYCNNILWGECFKNVIKYALFMSGPYYRNVYIYFKSRKGYSGPFYAFTVWYK